jgi:NTF2 fold immunity protein
MREKNHDNFVFITKALLGGMIKDAETATAIAAAILNGHYGREELARQQPLNATDAGDSWFVKGSYRDPGLEPADGGAWYIRIMKDDSRIVDLGHRIMDLQVPDDVRELIQQERARRGREGG